MNKTLKISSLAVVGAGVLALPAPAHADTWNVNLRFGQPAVYYRPAPVAVRYVPAPAPVRVTNYYPYPVYQRVVHGYGRPYQMHRGDRHGWRAPRYKTVAYRW